MEKLYERINFENVPSKKTPLSEENLNKMDKAIGDLDDRVIGLDARVTEETASVKSDLSNLSSDLSNEIANLMERSKNIFNCDSAELLDIYFTFSSVTGYVTKKMDAKPKTKSVIIPVSNANGDYVTIHVDALSNRFQVCALSNNPIEMPVGEVVTPIDAEINNNLESDKTITLHINGEAQYIWLYFYHSNYDVLSAEEIASTIMVQYGAEYTGYQSYYVPKNTARIEALEEKVVDLTNDRWTTRGKMYGIQFDTADDKLMCTRIADAVGLTPENDDFGKVYPWCDMRLCNVSIEGRKKRITYKGEAGFTLDGSNGNVMVEIPAFYVMRERIGTTERWLISGEKKGGFELHPWFRNADGSTVEHRYYGAYKATVDMVDSKVFSHTGTKPFQYKASDTDIKNPSQFEDLLVDTGFSRNTIYAISAIQYLFCVEYGTLNSQSVFNGVTYCPYYSSTSKISKISNVGDTTNTLKMHNVASTFGNSMLLFCTGMNVYLGSGTGQVTDERTIVSIANDSDYIYITVDGDAVAVTDNLYCYPTAQHNGRTDNLVHISGIENGTNEKVASFKYRNIENVWGNLWEMLDGVRIMNGVYYLTDETNHHDTTVDNWIPLGYAAPMVSATDKEFTNRVTRLGVDNEYRCIALPDTLFVSAPATMTYNEMGELYFGGDAYYSGTSTTDIYAPCFGGGWDHHENAGLFCMRFLSAFSDKNWLYGERITC